MENLPILCFLGREVYIWFSKLLHAFATDITAFLNVRLKNLQSFLGGGVFPLALSLRRIGTNPDYAIPKFTQG